MPDWNKANSANDIVRMFEGIYGKQYGFSPEYQKLLFQQGVTNLQPQFASMGKSGLNDLNQRGFNSAVPYSNMQSNLNSQYGRSLGQLQQSISAQSGQAAEAQKASLFGQTSDFLSQYNLMQLQKRLGKKGFMDFLGNLFGQGADVLAGWAGGGFK